MLTTLTQENWPAFAIYLFIDRKLDRGKDGHNERSYQSLFKAICNFFDNRPFSRDIFNQFVIESQTRHLSSNTINNYIKVAKHIDNFLVLKNPEYAAQFHDYELFKVVRPSLLNEKYLTWEQMESIANLIIPSQPARNKWRTDSLMQNRRWRCFWLLLARTGCRPSEALYLTFADIGTKFVIWRDTKSTEDRINFVDQELCNELLSLEKRSEYVFAGDTGRPMDDGYVTQKLKQRLQQLGIDESFTCKDFRSSYVTLMNMSGCPMSITAKRVGHKDLQTTMRYDRSALMEQEKAMEQYHPYYRESRTRDERYKSLIEALELHTNSNQDIVSIKRDGELLSISVNNIFLESK